MLSSLRVPNSNPSPMMSDAISARIACDDRFARNMQEDMKEAIDLLFKLKAGLDKLHPECLCIIERMISLP